MCKTFQCIRCGACCRWEGPVRVSEKEVDAIAEFLSIPVRDFLRDHTVLTSDRRSLSLKEKPDGSCCYYDEQTRSCRIQAVKPAQCRDFPVKWNFPGWEKLCAGAQQEIASYPVYRGPVKLMAALVLVFGSVPGLEELKIMPFFRGTLSWEGFRDWWLAWFHAGDGFAMILLPLFTAAVILYQILGRLTRKTRYILWFAALLVLGISGLILFRKFPALVQFQALVISLGGVALWLSRPIQGNEDSRK